MSAGPRATRVLLVGEPDLSHGALLDRLGARLGAEHGVEARVRAVPEPSRAEAALIARAPWPSPSLRWRLHFSSHARRLLRAELGWADVALVNTQSAALLASGAMRRLPTVLSVDFTGVQYDAAGYEPRPAGALARRLEHRALHAAAAVACWTAHAAGSVRRDYGVPSERVLQVHPGIDAGAWALERPPRADGAPLQVLFVGNEVERKGLPALLAARRAAAVPVELHVVTGDPVPEEPGVVVHHGLRPGTPGLLERFARADAFALPTTADAAPWVVLEAMAAGLPVLATDVGAIGELLGGTGELVPPGDTAALTAALERLAADGGRRARMGRAASARVHACYSSAVQVPTLLDVLRRHARHAPS